MYPQIWGALQREHIKINPCLDTVANAEFQNQNDFKIESITNHEQK